MLLKDQAALVTGGGSGIGKATAELLAKNGAAVMVADWDEPAAQATADVINAAGGRALAQKMDVSKQAEAENAVERTVAEFGRIDILVNNAGISAPGFILDVPLKHWDLVMNVNVRGVYLCTRAFLPTMIDQRSGCIINVSSYASQAEGSWGLAHSVSKAALERLTTGLAAEVQPYNIAVNALQIERFVASEGFVYLTPSADHSTWDKPEVVGEATLWLISRDPSYTGHVVTLGDIEGQRPQA